MISVLISYGNVDYRDDWDDCSNRLAEDYDVYKQNWY